ncbi:Bestrophin, RFP-TM, chloride channel-domain-containing protein [Lentinula raphanica]|nr:Bestrophin, RFP-TM, chloride channel-domain-containing protein [Lentinula raphanica]
MVASNPMYSSGMSLRKKFLATVINDIWPETLFFTAVATMVAAITKLTPHQLFLDNGLLGVLGTVLGLVISFRTSSAYERYSDGRKMWTNIATYSRTLAMTIWIHITNDRPAPAGGRAPTELECIIEKKSMINLVQALSVSIKHYLRGESGVYYQDLYPLVCFLPRYANGGKTEHDLLPMWHASEDGEYPLEHNPQRSPGSRSNSTNTMTSNYKEERSSTFFGSLRKNSKQVFDPEKVLPVVEVHRPLKPSRNPPRAGFTDYFPFLKIFKLIAKPFRKSPGSQDVDMRAVLGRKRKPRPCDSNVPVELSLFLMNYANVMIRAGYIPAPVAGTLVGAITSMQDTLSNLERIADTPLPFAYQAHLRISIWIYLLALPFQIVKTFGWLTIPGTAFTTFLYLGFLEIGQEIENPFNYDLNDLDLDDFCYMIQRELHEITAHPTPNPSEYVFGPWNQPFAPADRRTAQELIQANQEYTHSEHGPDSQPGSHSIQRTLLKGWKAVDTSTRK